MKRLSMRKIGAVLRLSAEGMSTRQIAASLATGRTTLRGYLDRARDAEVVWPLPPEMSDTDLERLIFPRTARDVSNRATQPDWSSIHRELRRKGVTLALLWEEYRSDHPEGFGYSRFCELYTRWEDKLSPVMRQRHLLPPSRACEHALPIARQCMFTCMRGGQWAGACECMLPRGRLGSACLSIMRGTRSM